MYLLSDIAEFRRRGSRNKKRIIKPTHDDNHRKLQTALRVSREVRGHTTNALKILRLLGI